MSVLAVEQDHQDGLADRLLRAFSVQVEEIEKRIGANSADGIVEDAKVLSVLAKTLETLVGVQRRLSGEQSDEPVDFEVLRDELATRLNRLRVGTQEGCDLLDDRQGG
ncbi:MAG: hypothetical protein AAGB11_03760 [Pseudomonadota bacterium]